MHNSILKRLEREGINEVSFQSAQILCLPENLLSRGVGEELLETTDMDVLTKRLRSVGVSVFTFMDAGKDLAAIERRAADKWYGTVWIRDIAAIPLLVAVIGNVASNKIGDAFKNKNGAPELNGKVHIELIVDDSDGAQKTLKYTGDGNTLVKVLKIIEKGERGEN